MKPWRLTALSVAFSSVALTASYTTASAQFPEPDHECVADCDSEGNIPAGALGVAACMYTSNPTAACLSQEESKHIKMLGGELVNGFLEQVGLSVFMLYLPEVYYPAQTAKFLYDVENGAIGVVQAKIEYDLGRVQTLQWPTEEDKRRALVIIQNDEKTIEKWNREAREEARTGINWTRLSPSNGSRGYRFNPGRSYEQLRTIQSFGWLKR